MDPGTAHSASTPVAQPGRKGTTQLGERVRQLRIAAGLTQSDLAADRFSKEYISQIERGKTRPTHETVEWLAQRLGVDSGYMANGVSADERAKAEAVLTRAEALAHDQRHDEARTEFERALPLVAGSGAIELRVRALSGQAMACAHGGDVKEGLALLHEARELTERPEFTDLDRADVLYRLGVCRCLHSSSSTAIALLNEALALAVRSGMPCDELRLNIFSWRSRCYRRQRDFEAAREDVEHALELADALRDPRALGQVYFQASVLAERGGQWVLARTYAQKAKAQFEELSDRATVGRLLNNLGGLEFLLGKPNEAIEHFKRAVSVALDLGHDEEAAAAIASLAQVHLRTGDVVTAEEQARHALQIMGDREDMLDHVGHTQLLLGRAVLEQDRFDEAEALFASAEDIFAQLSSGAEQAGAWMAQGDLATKRGDHGRAAGLFRRAAEKLQDFQF